MAEFGVARHTRGTSRFGNGQLRATLLRYSARAAMLAGFAGAAWLLSAAPAQADNGQSQDAAPETKGSSVVSLVTDLGGGLLGVEKSQGSDVSLLSPVTNTVGSLLNGGDAATADPASDRSTTDPGADHDQVTPSRHAAGTAHDRAVESPSSAEVPPTAVTGGDPLGHPTVAKAGPPAGPDLFGLLDGLTAPLGLADVAGGPISLLAPLTSVADTLTAPVNGLLPPVTDVLRSAAAPVTATLGSVLRSVTGGLLGTPDERPTVTSPVNQADETAEPTAPVADDGRSPAERNDAPAHRFSPVAERDGTVSLTGVPGSDELPTRPFPAPLPAHLGAGTGVPALGTGSTDGGQSAVAPFSALSGTVSADRLPATADVAVLHASVETPTLPPD